MRQPDTAHALWILAALLFVAAAPPSRADLGGSSGENPLDELNRATPQIETETWHRDANACSRSTVAALRACKFEVEDDFWVRTGRCLNLADADERRACLAGAEAERRDALKLCAEQFRARQEACHLAGEAPYDPDIEASNFLSAEEAAASPHPYFPLAHGNTWTYRKGDESTRVTVLDETVEILGVECFRVRDVVSENGVAIEDTEDWYAQDRAGNVWYFGEFVQNFEDGKLANLDGSWTAGVEGGRPGIIMKAAPRPGDTYRQEFLLGDVEDLGQVLGVTATERAPGASCKGDGILTRDFTPIEPGNEGRKYYARGVGLMLEVNPKTGDRDELIEFRPGPGARLDGNFVDSLKSQLTTANAAPLQVRRKGAGWVIGFAVRENADVGVDLYDTAGRRLRSLARGPLRAGEHTLEWDGTDGTGQRVPAGVYFVRVRTGSTARSEKVVVTANE